MIPISSLALTLGKVDVQSAIDEPLRATVNVNNIAVPLTQLKAGVATASAYSRLGASRQSLPNLRFLLKDLGQGNAQMWIVSNVSTLASTCRFKQPALQLRRQH